VGGLLLAQIGPELVGPSTGLLNLGDYGVSLLLCLAIVHEDSCSRTAERERTGSAQAP
jgi:hypothetical protein